MDPTQAQSTLQYLNIAGQATTNIHDAAIALRDALIGYRVTEARGLADKIIAESEKHGAALKGIETIALAAKEGTTAAGPGLPPGMGIGDAGTAPANAGGGERQPLDPSDVFVILTNPQSLQTKLGAQYSDYVNDYNMGGGRLYRPELISYARMTPEQRVAIKGRFASPRDWVASQNYDPGYITSKVPEGWAGLAAQLGLSE